MWEYELALSPDEVEQITAHTWELLRTRYAYYFFKQNCAYRMSELLGLVIVNHCCRRLCLGPCRRRCSII